MKVSIIIPILNERKFIRRCLESILKNDYKKDLLEILIFDGGSNDGTYEILKEYEKKYEFIKLFHNPQKYQVYALNEGIRKAKGDIIIRCDAHSEYPENYISTLVDYHKLNLADNIGGVWEVLPGNNTLEAKAISIAMNSKFGVGISYRTLRDLNKPIYVDTVPFGSWKKEVFEKHGLFDENFIRAEDFEHNMRIKLKGGKILLIPWLKIKYFARESFKKLSKMSYQYGYAKALILKKFKSLGNKRQLIPPIFVLTLPISLPLYLLLYSFISIWLSWKNDNLRLFPYVLSSFFSMHFFYGVGYLKGIWDIFIKKKVKEDFEVTR